MRLPDRKSLYVRQVCKGAFLLHVTTASHPPTHLPINYARRIPQLLTFLHPIYRASLRRQNHALFSLFLFHCHFPSRFRTDVRFPVSYLVVPLGYWFSRTQYSNMLLAQSTTLTCYTQTDFLTRLGLLHCIRIALLALTLEARPTLLWRI